MADNSTETRNKRPKNTSPVRSRYSDLLEIYLLSLGGGKREFVTHFVNTTRRIQLLRNGDVRPLK